MAKQKKKTTLSDLIPDAELRERMVSHLYSKKPLLSEGSVFSELLQGLVNKMLKGEMEDFMDRFSAQAEKMLKDRPTEGDLSVEFGRRLVAALPLDSYGSTSCRQCGLCDLAEEKIAEHLEAPARCLFKSSLERQESSAG